MDRHIENLFDKTPVGSLNTMALVLAQTLIRRGMPESEAISVTNEVLKVTQDIITGKTEAIIRERL